MVVLKDRIPDNRDLVSWRWGKGPAIAATYFGDPTVATEYRLCIYDHAGGSPELIFATGIPGGGSCGSTPCWRSTTHGFRYKNRDATPDGIVSLTLKAGSSGAAQITLEGIGPDLGIPHLPLLQDPTVTVQLVNDEAKCWSADFSAPALVNGQPQFRDKTD